MRRHQRALMTHRLYYTDPYLRDFDATIVDVGSREDRVTVELDQTAFYPTSGGQPFDTGTLGTWRVVEVIDDDDGMIAHVIEGASGQAGARPAPGQRVHGTIDWARRFDHMQQHTGQHVLSAAFNKLFAIRTVSFHLGAEVSTIDLARTVSAAEMDASEREANRIVWENRSVTIRFADADEAAKLPLRKEPARGATLRLIEVEDFDLSACGGTHVALSGGIGIIAVTASERFKGGQRIEFVCGGRALRRFQALRDSAAASVRQLSVLPHEIPGAIERLQAEAKEKKRAFAGLQTELAAFRAEDLARTAETTPAGRLVLRSIDGDAGALKSLAMAITSRDGYVVVLVSQSRPLLVVVARSADVSVASQHAAAELTKQFGGRGGGRPELAQAGGLEADAETVLGAAREIVSRADHRI
jgi:alanyl-tRNA synthetase